MSTVQEAERALDEVRRRYRERAAERFKPSPKQKEADDALDRCHNVLFVGANGVGKSTLACHTAYAYAKGFRPWDGRETRMPPSRVGIFCEDFTHSSEEDICTILNAIIPTSDIVRIDRLANGKPHKWTFTNHSTLKLMSYEQAPKTFEGVQWHFVVFNEPPPRSVWIPTLRGISKASGRCLFAMTPVGEESAWIFDELYSRAGVNPDIHAVTATIADSFMPEDRQQAFIDGLDEDEREARVYGRFRHLVGRVYKEFDPAVHVLRGEDKARITAMASNPSVPKGIVIDPHDRKPFAIAWFLVTPENHLVFFREWPEGEYHTMKSSRVSITDYANLIEANEETIHPVLWRLMDPNFGPTQKLGSDSTQEAFEKLGLYFETEIQNSVPIGHLAVNQRLLYDTSRPIGPSNRPRLYITDDCRNLQHAFTHYCWRDRRSDDGKVLREKPGETAKDFADLVRYTCVYVQNYVNPANVARLIQPKSDRFMGVL